MSDHFQFLVLSLGFCGIPALFCVKLGLFRHF